LIAARKKARKSAASYLERKWKLRPAAARRAVAVTALEIVAVHAVVGLDVADGRLGRGASFHRTFDRCGGSPDLAEDKDAEPVQLSWPR
jgi:hypothetical protein